MRWLLVLIASLTLAACGRDRRPPPTTAATPDPRLSAAFTDIFREATAAASKARELHESDLLSATRLDD